MRFWNKKERPVEAVAFCAIFAGIVALLSLACAFLPLLTPLLMLFVPLTVVIVSLVCKAPYVILFIVASFGASLSVAFWDFQTLLFYLLPSLLVGGVFGLSERLGLASSHSMFLGAILEVGAFFFSSWLCTCIYGINIVDLFQNLFGNEKTAQIATIFPLFALMYGFGQSLLIVLTIQLFFQKLHQENEKKHLPIWVDYAFGFAFLASSTSLVWLNTSIGFFLLGCLFYWVIATSIDALPYARKWTYAIPIIGLFAFTLIFAICYSKLPQDKALILVAIPFGILLLSNLLNQALPKKESKDTI